MRRVALERRLALSLIAALLLLVTIMCARDVGQLVKGREPIAGALR